MTVTHTENQTIIEFRIKKQHGQTPWPQLYSRHSYPILPEQNNATIDLIDQSIHSTIDEPQPYELPIRKTLFDFTETMDNKAIVKINLKEIRDCQVQYTETNFTATFYSKFVDVLQTEFHSLIT